MVKARQGSRPKKGSSEKASSRLEKERKQLRHESSRIDKAKGLKKEKARKVSSGLEKEIKHLRVESLEIDKAQGLKKGEKREKRASGSKKK